METTKKKLRINGHSHLLPYPEDITSFMREKEIHASEKLEKTGYRLQFFPK